MLDGGVPAVQRLAVVIDVPVLGEGAVLRTARLRAFSRIHPVYGGTGLGEHRQSGVQVLVFGASVTALFEPVVKEDLEVRFLVPVGRGAADTDITLPRPGRHDLPQRRGHVTAQARTPGDENRQALRIVLQRGHHQTDVIVTAKIVLEHECPLNAAAPNCLRTMAWRQFPHPARGL